MSRFLLATTTAHNAAELGRLLGAAVEPLPGYRPPVEDGASFSANARIKARSGRAVAPPDAWVVADDSGLCVDALGGAPGIHSARFGDPGLDDEGRLRLVLERLRGAPDRSAAYVCALVALGPEGREVEASGELRGSLAEAASGANGFGYDPIFVPAGWERTVADATAAEKDAISHRGRAARRLAAALAAAGALP
jgi:XTP/dITP diphosphohydrolase